MPQVQFDHSGNGIAFDERVCSRCMGHRHLCGINPCPLLLRAKALVDIDESVRGMNLTGSSPPSVFVGEHGYPKVRMGPLIPPLVGRRAAIMERPDLWLDKSIDEIIGLRFSLVRTKRPFPVDAAVDPPRVLNETQVMALSDSPADSEAQLLRKPQFNRITTGRTLPVGPSAPLDSFRLEENPSVPRKVDYITSDTDFRADRGIMTLFDEGIRQEHLTRLLSVGLLGQKKKRRLVPTKWSITAVDDIVGKNLHKEIIDYPWINDYMVFSDYALGNRVVLMFLPSAWQFEALECWLTDEQPPILSDYEWFKGRTDYANDVVGAYYATRLPALEHLSDMRKQAGVLVFMEIDPAKWVPLGVWRFREIARRALTESQPETYSTYQEATQAIAKYLYTPLERWLEASYIHENHQCQKKITDFF
ncbi:MAG: Nre family DNA repair protein [Candidatus Thorarchaeota archaeon]